MAEGTHYSHLLKANTTADTAHFILEAQVYFNMSTATITKWPADSTTMTVKTTKLPYHWTKFGYSGVKDLFTKLLTLEAIDCMVLVHG